MPRFALGTPGLLNQCRLHKTKKHTVVTDAIVTKTSLYGETGSWFHIIQIISIQLAVVAEKSGVDGLFYYVIWDPLGILPCEL